MLEKIESVEQLLSEKKDAYKIASEDDLHTLDVDLLERELQCIEYNHQNAHSKLRIIEHQRTYLHDVCHQEIDIVQRYERLLQQVSSFEAKTRRLHYANQTLQLNNELAESMFGSLDILISHVGSIQQTYQDTRNTSLQYTQELDEETENCEQFQEL